MEPKDLIGLDKEAAIKMCADAGIECRVSMEDGEARMLTQDMRVDRINLAIDKGKVVKFNKG